MKTIRILLLCALLLFPCLALAQGEVHIALSDGEITVDATPITQDHTQSVFLALEKQTHEDVPQDLTDLENRVVVIAKAGTYRISGKACDLQIAVRAGENDDVRLILDGADVSCRTAPAIAVESARDPRTAGQYAVTIELAAGSENRIAGSHTVAAQEDGIEYDGAIGSQVSLGFEGSGSLVIDADNEGVEVASGHLTINGGVMNIAACDDPLNVSEDGVGTLTVNDGYVYSSVKPLEGGEGDGVDSNGYIVFNGGTVINLAHPGSMDSGIDADMGSVINGGVIVGAGNMYDPIDENSKQLFMMLEFGQQTDSLVVVTDENDVPVFAYDFPHDYMYIAFSTPELTEGTYRVYLGGDIKGEETNGLYTAITAYTPGVRMQHGEGSAQMRMQPGPGAAMNGMPDAMQALDQIDLNELLKDADLNALLKDLDLNRLLAVYPVTALLSEAQLSELGLSGADLSAVPTGGGRGGFGGPGMGGGGRGGFGGEHGFGGPRGLESSAETATGDFVLTKDSTGFTNVIAAQTDGN